MGRPGLGRRQLKQVAVVATLDSKAAAAQHAAALVAAAGARPLLVDVSCLRDPELAVHRMRCFLSLFGVDQ